MKVGVILVIFFLVQCVSANMIPIYMNKIRDLPIEYAYVFDQNGTLLFNVKGNESCIWFNPYELDLLKGNILIHNHPNGNYLFSDQDIALYGLSGLKEMWVIANQSESKMTASGQEVYL